MFVFCFFKLVNRKVLFLKMKLLNYFLIIENVVFFIRKKKISIMFYVVSLRVCKYMIIYVVDFYVLCFLVVEFYWLMYD